MKRHTALLALIILFAIIVRFNTFWISHWSGDQENYIALAMKLDRFGMAGYNLRGVDVRVGRFVLPGVDKGLLIGEVVPAGPGERGSFLKLREMAGITQYDIPLYYLGPAFPYALMCSHRLFAKDIGGYRAPATSLDGAVKRVRPRRYFEAQFYAAVVPLSFSLLLITLTFFLGRELFSESAGVYAAFMMASSAVDIVTSQRVWPADMVSALVALTAVLFLIAVRKRSSGLSFLAGAIFGLAILTRQNVALVFLSLGLYAALKGDWRRPLILLAGTVAVSSFWFVKTFQVYGTPVYDTAFSLEELIADNKTNFYETMLARPSIPVLYAVGIPYLSPVFALAYASLKDLLISLKGLFAKGEVGLRFVFLWTWIIVFAVYLAWLRPISREHRYMLPTYPAIAALAAYALTGVEAFIIKVWGGRSRIYARAFIILLLLLSALWSVPIGIDEAITNKSFILKPF